MNAAQQIADIVSSAPVAPPPDAYDLGDMNGRYALVSVGAKAVVMREQPGGPPEDRIRMLSIDAFMALERNRKTTVLVGERHKTVSVAQRWMDDPGRRTFLGLQFKPCGEADPGYYNLWRGFSVEPRAGAGSYGIFRDHVFSQLCGQDQALFDWVWGWFAHIVQRPAERLGTALVLRGRMGSGKTIVGETIGSLISSHYYMVDDARYVVGQFNSHMSTCLLLQSDEAVWAGDKASESRMKGLITSSSQMIEHKGIDPIRLDNFVRLLITSNEDWCVPAGKDERRFCVLDVDPRCLQQHEYFAEMKAELDAGGREALLADLLAVDLDKVNLRAIPRTAALLDQKTASFDSVEEWWLGRLLVGGITHQRDDWPDVVPRQALIRDYDGAADRTGWKRKAPEHVFAKRLRKIVPGLEDTRRQLDPGDGSSVAVRTRCYLIPPLADCRAAFEESIGQHYPWPPDPESG